MPAPQDLTEEELDSLLDLAAFGPRTTVVAEHLLKLIELGFVVETDKGHILTGDALMRITQSED